MNHKSDQKILDEYCEAYKIEMPEFLHEVMLNMVRKFRLEEPRINCGLHLIDYLNICDEDDDMDSFYGPNYPW